MNDLTNELNNILNLDFNDKNLILNVLKFIISQQQNNPTKKYFCANISDNTMSLTDDTIATDWRVHLVELTSEQDIYIDIKKAQNNSYSVLLRYEI